MNELLPGKKRHTSRGEKGQIIVDRMANTLDWKAKVVCEPCNNTWMSELENKHAKPAMTPLILGKTGIVITSSQADSIARFGFKTAVVIDYLARRREPFFTRWIRHGFRETQAIPAYKTAMWLSACVFRESGLLKSMYHEGSLPTKDSFELYVCTYSVGHLVFQAVSFRPPSDLVFRPKDTTFDNVAIPFWPWVKSDAIWPPGAIRTREEFWSFSERWRRVLVNKPTSGLS